MYFSRSLRTFVPIAAVAGIFLLAFYERGITESFPAKSAIINGVSLVNPHRIIDSSEMAEVKRINSEWVAVIPIAFARKSEPTIYFNNRRQWWGERLEGTAKLIELAHQNQLKVMLKPHVWLREQWIGDFDLDSEEKWKQWEDSYKEYMMAFAHLADSMNVSMFCIGTELKVAAINRPDYFQALIAEVRTFYQGKLTYAANWDSYQMISFWEDLDYVGVDGYFPLVADENPTIDAIDQAWIPVKNQLKQFSKQTGKQILFAEYGYQSLDGAAGNHWEVHTSSHPVNLELQARAYECLYKCLWIEPWFAGGFLWKWHFRESVGGVLDGNFTPQGKPVEEVIARWYDSSQKGLSSRED